VTPPPASYLVALRLAGRRCVVVGGGTVATSKVAGLLAAGARVVVIAPEVTPALREQPVEIVARPYSAGDLSGCWFAVAATGRAEVDRQVFAEAEAAGIYLNAADDPAACSAYLPAVVRHAPVTVAVSTDGTSPALAAVLRDRIAAAIGDEVGRVALVMGEARAALRRAGRASPGPGWRALADELLSRAGRGESGAELRGAARAWVEAAHCPRGSGQGE
jgi:siroheme synthase-like protein